MFFIFLYIDPWTLFVWAEKDVCYPIVEILFNVSRFPWIPAHWVDLSCYNKQLSFHGMVSRACLNKHTWIIIPHKAQCRYEHFFFFGGKSKQTIVSSPL
jgi:hypothetical protein